MNEAFLDRMAGLSHARLREAVSHERPSVLRRRAAEAPPPPPLRLDARFDLIAELKRRSPAAGELGAATDVVARVRQYAGGGAAAISVLTEPSEFRGSLDDLAAAAAALTDVPVMRKDFLVDPYQLYEARAAGAGGVLLIVRMLDESLLSELLDCARELGLFVLLECFNEADVESASSRLRSGGIRPGSPLARSEELISLAPGDPATSPARKLEAATLIGVNCRDLRTLQVMPERLVEMAGKLPAGAVGVAESGVETPDDCAGLVRAGYRMALVGSALMKAADPAAMVTTMLAAGRAA